MQGNRNGYTIFAKNVMASVDSGKFPSVFLQEFYKILVFHVLPPYTNNYNTYSTYYQAKNTYYAYFLCSIRLSLVYALNTFPFHSGICAFGSIPGSRSRIPCRIGDLIISAVAGKQGNMVYSFQQNRYLERCL